MINDNDDDDDDDDQRKKKHVYHYYYCPFTIEKRDIEREREINRTKLTHTHKKIPYKRIAILWIFFFSRKQKIHIWTTLINCGHYDHHEDCSVY